MDWPTTIGIGTLVLVFGLTTLFLVRWGANNNDSSLAANKAELEQAANQREAERQRDAEHVLRVTAEGNLAVALDDNTKLHATIDRMITDNATAMKAKIDAASGDDLIALARTAMGVPVPLAAAARATGNADAGGGAAAAAAVHLAGPAAAR